jgi:catechol 2,3-dioxygenase-like lactoylglutathione lyase family enzyme
VIKLLGRKSELKEDKMKYNFRLDHFSILVSNLNRSISFYRDVFGFDIVPREGTEPIGWLAIGGHDTIHISEGNMSTTHFEKDTHFALRVIAFDEFLADLARRAIPYFDWPGNRNEIGYRFDGFRQVYLQDPDGYWIEVNDHSGGDVSTGS